MSTPGNGWNRYEERVLSELADLKSEVRAVRQEMTETKISVAMLQVKAGVWGALAGLIPFGLFAAYQIAGAGS